MSQRIIQVHAPDDNRVLYTLRFEYIQDSRKLYTGTQSTPNLFLLRGAVRLYLHDAADKLFGWGNAYCYRKDKWDPKKGERIALGKALKVHSNPLQKPARAMIWQQYFTARPLVEPVETAREERKRKVRERMEKAHRTNLEKQRSARVERKRKIQAVLDKLPEGRVLIGYDASKGDK